MSGTLDEEVDNGSCGSSANPPTDSDHKWSTPENDSQDKVTRVYRLVRPKEQR